MRFSRLLTIPLAYVALTTAAWAQDKAARVGLVIGNTTYAAADPALSAVSTDARQLAEEFRKNNFDVDLKENLNLSEMRRAIDTFIGKIREGSAAVLYFGGYGIQIGGKNYLIPVDSQISSEETARVDGISVDTTVAEMHRRGAKVKIVIIDAARRNPYETKFRRDAAGLATLSAPEGMLAIYSAGPGKVVPLQPGAPSLFMRELLKQIQVPKRSFEDVLNNVRNIVSRGTNYEQSPWVSISLYDQFYIVQEQPAKTATTTTPAAKAATATTAPATTTTAIPAGTSSPTTATTPAAKAATTTTTPAAKTSTTTPAAKSTTTPVETKTATAPSNTTTTTAPTTTTQPQPRQKIEGADDPAIIELGNNIRQNSKDIASYYRRGQLYAQYSSFQQAADDFDAVIRLDPKDSEALNNRCWVRAVLGDLQAAMSDCNSAIQLRPGYTDAFDSRGFVNLKLGKTKEAIADYDSALRVNPKHASALYGRGLAKVRSGSLSVGNYDISLAKQIRPGIVEEFAKYGVR